MSNIHTIVLFQCCFLLLQTQAQDTLNKYFVFFTDKSGSTFNINYPEYFLSEKAIERREHHHLSFDTYDLPISQLYIDTLIQSGFSPILTSKWLNGVLLSVSDSLIDSIQRFSFVQELKQVYNYQSISNKRNLDKLETHSLMEGSAYANYGHAFVQQKIHNLEFLHDLGFKGKGISIAVLDAGFINVKTMSSFQSLWENNQLSYYKDIINNDNDPFHSSIHGTMVLSTMAPMIEGEFIGTAPEANYLLFRTEDGSSEQLVEEIYWVKAAEIADSLGVDIINSSLGYTHFDDSTQNHTYADMDGNSTLVTIGADIAASRGILVVNSAGNSGSENWRYISAPADGDSVLTVGAINLSQELASFSSVGPTSDGDIKPNVMALGSQTAVIYTDENYGTSNGTSFSSPIMAGILACLWQSSPDSSNMEIIRTLQKNAHLSDAPTNEMGYGIPDLIKAYWYLQGNETDESDILFGPNPTSDNIKIILPFETNETVEIRIVSADGNILLNYSGLPSSNGFSYWSFPLENLSNGIYILKVETDKTSYHKKFVKL